MLSTTVFAFHHGGRERKSFQRPGLGPPCYFLSFNQAIHWLSFNIVLIAPTAQYKTLWHRHMDTISCFILDTKRRRHSAFTERENARFHEMSASNEGKCAAIDKSLFLRASSDVLKTFCNSTSWALESYERTTLTGHSSSVPLAR